MKTRIEDTRGRLGRRPTFRFQDVLIMSVFLFGAVRYEFSQSALSASVPTTPALTIVVDNYSRASIAELGRAEREADRIFGRAGLRTVWQNCSARQITVEKEQSCHKPVEATDVRLRILPAPVLNKFQNTVFGFVVHPVLASVYYDNAVRLAKIDDAQFEFPIILGCAIAHEIGHLLLGLNNHSSDGIMRSKWEREQIEQAMWGTLLFTSEQSRIIQEEARRRTLASSSDALSPDVIIIGGPDSKEYDSFLTFDRWCRHGDELDVVIGRSLFTGSGNAVRHGRCVRAIQWQRRLQRFCPVLFDGRACD